MKRKDLSNKETFKLKLFEQKWFKLICLVTFFGWLSYVFYDPFEINKHDLIELNVTIEKEWKSGGSRNPMELYFKTKEYSSQFGISVGGTFGRWTEVTQTLEENRKIVIKIDKTDEKKLNAEEVIPIYYLSKDDSSIVFNENDFDEGEKKSDNRVLGFFLMAFFIGIWRILTD